MTVERLGLTEFLRELAAPLSPWSSVADDATQAVVVDCAVASDRGRLPRRMNLPSCPVLAVAPEDSPHADFADATVASEAELDTLLNTIAAQPHAATVLVQLLRQSLQLTPEEALFAESLAYSTLQHARGFKSWLTTRSAESPPVDSTAAVVVQRHANQLQLTLNRPARRNAYSSTMRDTLCEALALALVDPSIEAVRLQGAGAAFCAGGDLAEFGEARDAAVAHLSRTSLSAAALLLQMPEKIQTRVHGACIGAGIELPAFGAYISAAAESFFQLPEVAMGLVPGAGGTVSLPRRIGRQRTVMMALSGARVDARTALAWGLVDELLD